MALATVGAVWVLSNFLSCGGFVRQRWILSIGLAVFLSVLAPLSTTASPIGFTGPMDFTGTGHGAGISATLTTDSGSTYTAGWAGEINWSWGDGNAATVDAIPDGFAQAFYSYCVDITQYLTDPQAATILSSSDFTNGVEHGGGKAAWLFNEYADGIRFNTASLSLSELNSRAAGLQVAIWEAMYDIAGDLSAGHFTLATGNPIRGYADGYVASLYLAGPSEWTASPALILNTSKGQDQITNVPEPSTVVLMAMGLLASMGVARSRTSAA
jgi:hypothetical protein